MGQRKTETLPFAKEVRKRLRGRREAGVQGTSEKAPSVQESMIRLLVSQHFKEKVSRVVVLYAFTPSEFEVSLVDKKKENEKEKSEGLEEWLSG